MLSTTINKYMSIIGKRENPIMLRVRPQKRDQYFGFSVHAVAYTLKQLRYSDILLCYIHFSKVVTPVKCGMTEFLSEYFARTQALFSMLKPLYVLI